jgi:hypothetical protein
MARILRSMLVTGLVVGAVSLIPAPSGASGLGADRTVAAPCARVQVRATPKLNAQNAPFETIRSRVTNCSTATETLHLSQHLAGPFAPRSALATSWNVTLGPHRSVDKVRRVPYSCCGTYTVSDVVSSQGRVLDRSTTSFTFA